MLDLKKLVSTMNDGIDEVSTVTVGTELLPWQGSYDKTISFVSLEYLDVLSHDLYL